MTTPNENTETTSNESTPPASASAPPVALAPYAHLDIVKRAQPRRLPCKLTDEEMLRISRTRVAKEATRDELVADAKLDAEKRKDQIKGYDEEILVMRRELHTGYQDRTILTNEVFEPDGKGGGYIVIYRNDTNEPTGERYPASAAELQRHLPNANGTGSILDQATAVQRSAQPETAAPDAAVPDGLPTEDGDDDAEAEADADESKSNGKGRGGKKGSK